MRDTNEGAVLRKFRSDEIPHLLESELLVVDKGYYSLCRQTDRTLHGSDEFFGAGKKQRARVELILFLCRRMAHYRTLGMRLTPDGVEKHRADLDDEYKNYQARILYGTKTWNSRQTLKPLPANTTLLKDYRKFRKGQQNPKAFLPQRSVPEDLDHSKMTDFSFILRILNDYADSSQIAKSAVAQKAIDEAKKENERRKAAGCPILIKVKSARQYERWIDQFLDPFNVVVQRYGLAKAKADFGSVEEGMSVDCH